MSIVCLGTGRMGRGIALAFALKQRDVILLDAKERSPTDLATAESAAFDEMRDNLAALARVGALSADAVDKTLAHIRFAPLADAKSALAAATVVFEGVPEVMQVKRDAFAAIAHAVRPDTILASTSSTFLSTDVAKLVERPERFLNAHWLNPAFVVPLVEISPHAGTAPDVTDALCDLLEAVGKEPVRCTPAPGYIVPRLQALLMNEAARMIEEGVATAENIDRAIRFGLGLRFAGMGVVEFIDFGGNDILYYSSRYLADTLGDQRYASPDIIARHMREQRNGLKDGKGFYNWQDRDIAAYREALLRRLLALAAMAQKQT